MTITLNAQSESYPERSLTVREILARKRWSFPLVIARLNGELVPREAYAERSVSDGDALELYHLVSGG
ncbi:MAG TPA: sulfur carrier protein ThiS [Spirochaetia bacterium]|nr:sulfur carrier protein ThiS [Spirochaetales bacterium]HRY73123.1 sulfur carrier protein ThiS [Spirochaetia bacterium]